MSFRSTILAAAAIFATVNAHVKMASPVPFSVATLDTAPITKSQFPCKSNLGFTVSEMNKMAVGESQTLKLSGTAVHGGGSCQLSVTTDTEPTENSKFKVIKSMEGSCPGTDGSTNDYEFTLPASIPNGKATFAWSWQSKLSGLPELYMNCAPIEVSGGASDNSAFDALPDMLVINIDDTCQSVANFAVQYPNPGTVVQKGTANDLKAPTGSGCGSSSGTTPVDPSSPAGGEPSAAPTSAAPTSANNGQYSAPQTSAAPIASALPSNGGGVFAPGASSAPAVTSSAAVTPSAAPVASTSTTLVTVTGTPSAPSATVPLGTGSPAASSAPSTPSTGGSGTCTENGAVVCNGPDQFGLCNNGEIVWQAVAAGTTCADGTVTKRGYNGRIARPRWSSRRVVIPGRD